VLDPTVRSSALSVADTVADTVADAERKKNEFIANQFKEFEKDFQDRKKKEQNKGKGNAS
jgi:hypothetical protein